MVLHRDPCRFGAGDLGIGCFRVRRTAEPTADAAFEDVPRTPVQLDERDHVPDVRERRRRVLPGPGATANRVQLLTARGRCGTASDDDHRAHLFGSLRTSGIQNRAPTAADRRPLYLRGEPRLAPPDPWS